MAKALVLTKKLDVKTFDSFYVIPDGIGNLLINNTGASDVLLWFDDGNKDDYFLLSKNSCLPVIEVQSNVLRYKTLGTNGTLSLLMWG